MSPVRRKKTELDRRIQELEKESEKIRAHIKAVSRAVKKGEHWEERLPPPPPRTRPAQPQPRETPPRKQREEAKPTGDGDLFDWKSRPRAQEPVPDRRGEGRSSARERKSVQMDQKFASYLTSGSFTPATHPREDRSVQRNKAIFMIVVVLVVAFIIFKVVRYF